MVLSVEIDDCVRLIDELKTKIITVETALTHHQRDFEKHEARDDKRYHQLIDRSEVYHERNVDDHKNIYELIVALRVKFAWFLGIVAATSAIIQIGVQLWIQMSP